MKVLVTGSAGHLGEALVRRLAQTVHTPVGLDVKSSPFTHRVGSISDSAFVRQCVSDVDAIVHAATLHKPHVGTHRRQDFIDTNITGTLTLLEAGLACGIRAFVYTSTTSTFGDAMRPAPGAPAVWVTEDLRPKPKNIYGVTKSAAEDLCELFSRRTSLPCIVLKTSRFFPEADDDEVQRRAFEDENIKVNELLFRRADIEDIVTAHLLALERAGSIGFARLIVTATTPFERADAARLGTDAPSVLAERVPSYRDVYQRRGWRMFETIGRVYDNSRARAVLGWAPGFSFPAVLERLEAGLDYRSDLARVVGSKGYHDDVFAEGPYPVRGF